jgi:serine phosphatase RsbU (regulator of sigma subunit)
MTDRKVQHFEIGTMVTVVCAVSTPPYDQFALCSAGHLPPVLATPGQPSELLSLPVGAPLGALPDVDRTAAVVDLPTDGLLLLYTDGLVERRGQPIDDGLERLRAAVVTQMPEIACRNVMHQLVGTTPTTDDIALLAVQRTG